MIGGALTERSPMRILAVVVTRNRRDLLARCVDHLAHQSRLLDEILVIDHDSTDGTRDMLAARGVRCITQDNQGAAGGYFRGVQVALDEGFDGVWLMDDDGYPADDALEHLEAELTPGIACVSSVVLCEDRPTHFVFPFSVLDRTGLPVIFARRRKIPTLAELSRVATDGKYPFAHFFNGALVSLSAVRAVGNVDRGFFIAGEEVDFFYRLRRYGPVYSVLAARHLHPDVRRRPYSAAKIYYYVRNTFIVNARYLDCVAVRNLLTVAAVLGRVAARNGPGIAASHLVGRRAGHFYRAIARGLNNRLGNDFTD
jgi:GT2 family glycosyltransferase